MQHKVENLLTGKITVCWSDKELITFAQKQWVLDEGAFATKPPATLQEAFDYLNTYCDNLKLL